MPSEFGFRGNTNLPSDEELTFKGEPDLSYVAMKASAVYLGKYCETQNNEFMLCRIETNDPRKCLNDGKAVTACSLEFYKKLKKHCLEEFTTHAHCLNRSRRLKPDKCRASEKILDQCVLKNLNIERPPFGYFTEARVHDSPRPKPEPFVPEEYPDRTPPLPPRDVEYPKAKYGFRWMF